MTVAPRHRAGPRAAASVLALCVALAAGGCGWRDEGGIAEPPGSSPTLAEPTGAPTLQIEPVTSIGRVRGRLDRDARHRVERQVSEVAVRWLSAAYVGGDYPRGGFRDALPGFTRGAREAARRDLGVMTNHRIGRRVDAVSPSRIEVRVDMLGVHNRPVAATARVLTAFETSGKVARRVRVAGRLMLTRRDGHWQIFGYRINQGGTR